MAEHSYNKDFTYSHDNPYHDRLKQFSTFTMRDLESENFKGVWRSDVFNNNSPLDVEIGSGYGNFMIEYCTNNPERNFVGIDYRFKRSFKLSEKLNNIEKKNFRYLRAKGERIGHMFSENEIDNIFYFFPDPWPKNRHQKKRLFQEHFLKTVHKVLSNTGVFYIKTDHDDYANWMKKLIDQSPLFQTELFSTNVREEFPEHILSKYTTKFEKIFIKQNIPIKAFVLKPVKDAK